MLACTSNGTKDPLSFDGTTDAEVEKQPKEALCVSSTFLSAVTNLDPKLVPPLQYTMSSSSSTIPVPTTQPAAVKLPSLQFNQAASSVKPLGQVGAPEPSLQSSPARKEGEVLESELDPDTRRRLLMLEYCHIHSKPAG